jgi:hypothetical protein
MADNMETTELLITTTEIYLNNMGMKISPNKCASFQVQTTRDSWYISTTDLHLATGDKFPLQLLRISWNTLAATSPPGQAYNTKASPPDWNRYCIVFEVPS